MPGPFARAGEIVQLFGRLVGPFPYEKLAHLQSSTRFGGMENASEIFYSDGAFRRRTMNDGLIAHETAHQWFGDAVTEREWSHVWLSEGFATYFAALWTRAARGDSAFRAQMAGIRSTVLDDTMSVTQRPVIDTIETNYLALLNRNSYEKGGFVLHMLRAQVGERAFFDALRSYYAQASTLDGGHRRPARRDGARVEAEPRLVLRPVAATSGLSRSDGDVVVRRGGARSRDQRRSRASLRLVSVSARPSRLIDSAGSRTARPSRCRQTTRRPRPVRMPLAERAGARRARSGRRAAARLTVGGAKP